MKRIILINGLIAGAIAGLMLVISMPLHNRGILNYDNGMVFGYASMVIGLSTIFFGIKTYRDQHENGSITFWQAIKIGVLIALIASSIYALTWEVYYNFAGQNYMDKYSAYVIEKMEAKGASQDEIAAAKTQMGKFNEMYKNPIVRFGFTLMEILPVGIVITLISATLLRRRKFLPA
ncbi:MAG TPA: DUF4199 domain-containing protein [Chryseosolibacter sp.]|nr:DUF4199 domain-containing protein [Chryseosolibacter sp.]